MNLEPQGYQDNFGKLSRSLQVKHSLCAGRTTETQCVRSFKRQNTEVALNILS